MKESTAGIIAFHLEVKIDAEELRGWEPSRKAKAGKQAAEVEALCLRSLVAGSGRRRLRQGMARNERRTVKEVARD